MTERGSLLLEVLFEEFRGSLPGELGAGFVEAAALVAMESVRSVRIDVDFTIPAALVLDHLDVAHGNRRILVAEMHERRHFRLLVGVLCDLAAVIAHGSGEAIEPAGRQERDRAAHAEAHDGHRAAALE